MTAAEKHRDDEPQSVGGGPGWNRRELPNGAIVEDIPICGCTNTQLERGETCGQAICPNSKLPYTAMNAESSVRAGAKAEALAESGAEPPPHDCWENPVPYESDGALGHGWECGVCGAFLQAG